MTKSQNKWLSASAEFVVTFSVRSSCSSRPGHPWSFGHSSEKKKSGRFLVHVLGLQSWSGILPSGSMRLPHFGYFVVLSELYPTPSQKCPGMPQRDRRPILLLSLFLLSHNRLIQQPRCRARVLLHTSHDPFCLRSSPGFYPDHGLRDEDGPGRSTAKWAHGHDQSTLGNHGIMKKNCALLSDFLLRTRSGLYLVCRPFLAHAQLCVTVKTKKATSLHRGVQNTLYISGNKNVILPRTLLVSIRRLLLGILKSRSSENVKCDRNEEQWVPCAVRLESVRAAQRRGKI